MLKTLALHNFFSLSAPSRSAAVRRAAVAKPAAWQVGTAIGFGIVAVALLGSYLVSVNSYAARGYEIKKLQTQMAQLTEANQRLNVKVAQVSSMVAVQSQLAGADFIPAGTPQFLQVNQMTMR
jgi:hypothetical protein